MREAACRAIRPEGGRDRPARIKMASPCIQNLGVERKSEKFFILLLKLIEHERLPNDYQKIFLRQKRKKADPKIGLNALD